MKTILTFFLTITMHFSFAQEEIPKMLKYSFEYLEKNWDSASIETFKNYSENDSTAQFLYHRGIGLHLRNNLLRHHTKSKEINQFFDSLGIHHYDDMSSIILTSYRRYLNNQNIQLQEQVDTYIAYWKPWHECQKNQKIKAVEIYNKHQLGDTILIKMPVSKSNSANDYSCGTEWDFDPSKDLLVKGIITNKYNINSDSKVFFTVKVLTKSHLDTDIMMQKVSIGDEFKVGLNTAWKITLYIN